jgi:hypothetical protein
MESSQNWKWNPEEQQYEGEGGVRIILIKALGIWEVSIPLEIDNQGRKKCTGFETKSLEYAMKHAHDPAYIIRALVD